MPNRIIRSGLFDVFTFDLTSQAWNPFPHIAFPQVPVILAIWSSRGPDLIMTMLLSHRCIRLLAAYQVAKGLYTLTPRSIYHAH
ncbi:hypothetical protein K439DRAFT_809885 [Ramaria rubella]|nr:hypothetical protein K439DRAFT_809885 [Ramaria rubella]